MKTRLIALMLVAGGALFAETHIAIGVQTGGPGEQQQVGGQATFRSGTGG